MAGDPLGLSTAGKTQIACSQLGELVQRVHTVYSLKKWQTAEIPCVIRRWGCGNLWCSSCHSPWQCCHFFLQQTCLSRHVPPSSSHQNTVMDDLQICMEGSWEAIYLVHAMPDVCAHWFPHTSTPQHWETGLYKLECVRYDMKYWWSTSLWWITWKLYCCL